MTQRYTLIRCPILQQIRDWSQCPRPPMARGKRRMPLGWLRIPSANDDDGGFDEDGQDTGSPGLWQRCLKARPLYKLLATGGFLSLVVVVALVANHRGKTDTPSHDSSTREGPAPNAPMAPRWNGTNGDPANWRNGAPNSGLGASTEQTAPPKVDIPGNGPNSGSEIASAGSPYGGPAGDDALPDWRTQPYPNTAGRQPPPPAGSHQTRTQGMAQATVPWRESSRQDWSSGQARTATYDETLQSPAAAASYNVYADPASPTARDSSRPTSGGSFQAAPRSDVPAGTPRDYRTDMYRSSRSELAPDVRYPLTPAGAPPYSNRWDTPTTPSGDYRADAYRQNRTDGAADPRFGTNYRGDANSDYRSRSRYPSRVDNSADNQVPSRYAYGRDLPSDDRMASRGATSDDSRYSNRGDYPGGTPRVTSSGATGPSSPAYGYPTSALTNYPSRDAAAPPAWSGPSGYTPDADRGASRNDGTMSSSPYYPKQ